MTCTVSVVPSSYHHKLVPTIYKISLPGKDELRSKTNWPLFGAQQEGSPWHHMQVPRGVERWMHNSGWSSTSKGARISQHGHRYARLTGPTCRAERIGGLIDLAGEHK